MTFNDDVIIIGDGMNEEHYVIAGDKLNNFDGILENAKNKYK